MASCEKPVLVTGATGYVGGRLVRQLLHTRYTVRAVVRSLEKFRTRFKTFPPGLEVVQADLLNPADIRRAAEGCQAAVYLVHSLLSNGERFHTLEKQCARNMAVAAEYAGLERIIYLGGLGKPHARLSRHLRSRAEVSDILRQGTVPVTVLRAAIILGSGSASFEIIRYLVERMPVIPAPASINTKCQPICIRNVLQYLIGCLAHEETIGQTFDIGGPEIITYADLLRLYARIAGLPNRIIIRMPLLRLDLISYLVSLITPVPSPLVKALVLGLGSEVICTENRIRQIIPQQLMPCEEAISRALEKVSQHIVETYYHDAGDVIPPEWVDRMDAYYSKGPILECSYRIGIRSTPERVWEPIKQIGGKNGWYFAGKLWWLRGVMDKLVGGVGLDRGRRDPENIGIGDVIDWWRVLVAEPAARLLLLAEMKLPGEAILDFRLMALGEDETELTMHARFLSKGLAGLAYWYSVYPLHDYVFKGMLLNIAERCHAGITFGPEKL